MRFRILSCTFACSILLISCAGASEPIHTTVCAIVADRDRFLGQTVTVRAMWDVSYHFTLLKDESCPEVGIALLISDEASARDNVRSFIELTYQNEGTAPRGESIASFTGQLQMQDDPGEIPYLVLDLHSFLRP